jgi:L-ascorbate metabolism protein UlaG (beta-lactamase superfamily)
MKLNSPVGFLKLLLTEKRGEWPKWVPSTYGRKPPTRVDGDWLAYTFVNHSTVLIQTNGLNILTDPIWSYRSSPFSWVGPRRHRNPGIRFEDLPPIDIVLVSHNHYDHMDLPTLRRLSKEWNPRIIVGSGNGDYLERKGLGNVMELNWWRDTLISQNARITFVPAQHFSGRGLFDRNKTLWGGFVIQTPSSSIFFAGDSGYSPHFKRIYNTFGPMDLTFLPIGAYKPRDFMCAVHIDPAEAVKAHSDLHSAQSVGIHFGTFRLGFESMEDPRQDLMKALERSSIPYERFVVPDFGEHRILSLVSTEHPDISNLLHFPQVS